MRPTLLIGWELGGGAGHVHRLLPIVQAYLRQGWVVVAAVRNPKLAGAVFSPSRDAIVSGDLRIIQAPIFLHRSLPGLRASSLAEIFAHIGFAEVEFLGPVVRAWERILGQIKPTWILSDTSPSLNLAARNRYPITVIGNGWTVPPDLPDLPPLFEGPDVISAIARASSKILNAVNVLVGQDRMPDQFSDILRGNQNLVCTFKELDPYNARRSEGLYWPVEIPKPRPIISIRKRRYGFIYFPSKHPGIAAAINGISLGITPFQAYLGGESVHGKKNLLVSTSPINLTQCLGESRIAVHHGGLGTAAWCFVNRVSQLICCTDIEKALIAKGLSDAKAAIVFSPFEEGRSVLKKMAYLSDRIGPEPSYAGMVTQSDCETLEEIVNRSQAGVPIVRAK